MSIIETVRKTERKYGSFALSIAIAAGIACFLFGVKPIGKGLILGSLFSVVNFTLMGETLPMRIGHSRKKVTGMAFLMILLRYSLMAVPLAVGIKLDQYNLAAVIAGLFSVQLLIMTDHTFRMVIMKTRNNQVL